MHAELGQLPVESAERLPFKFDVSMRGMETIEFSPVGNTTEVTMEAAWPHPSFTGRYLPAERTINAQMFSARWQVSSFSSDMPRIIAQCAEGSCQEFNNNTFGVSLVKPVDLYQQTERAVKYAILFILLTFVAFFLFEIMKQLRLHPLQYLLVGMALTVFYLLLVSLSEHIAFHWAYLSAALSSTLLITVYVTLSFLFLSLLSGYLLNLVGLFVYEKLGFWPPDADIPLTNIPFLILVLFINIFAEELWWRGYILPRQELVHGKWAFLVNGVLWSLFHMFKCWAVPLMLLRDWMVPFVVQRTKNTTPGIFMHFISNGISV